MDAGAIRYEEVRGKRRILREGLEEAWAKRPRRRVQLPTSGKGKKRAQAKRAVPIAPSDEQRLLDSPPNDCVDSDGMPVRPQTTPSLEDERAWVEWEKRWKLRAENLKEEGKLVYKDDILKALNQVINNLLTQAHDVGRQVRLSLPHLTAEEGEIIDKTVLSIFEEVSNFDFTRIGE